MLYTVIWVVLAWVACSMAILGSLITLGSLPLWFIPPDKLKQAQGLVSAPTGQHRLTLMVFALAIALTGMILLVLAVSQIKFDGWLESEIRSELNFEGL